MNKLNVGCGRDIKKGWINIDKYSVDGAWKADIEKDGIPSDDNVFDYVYASHFLEHCIDIKKVVEEIHRVMKVGGILEVIVPYKFRSFDIGHHHFFNLQSMDAFIERGNIEDNSLEHISLFDLIKRGYHYDILPRRHCFRWHIKKYLGITIPINLNWGLIRTECFWILRKGIEND